MQFTIISAVLVLGLGLSGCGGSQEPSRSADDPGSDEFDSAEDRRSRSVRAEPEPESRCADGTCAVCGDGVCPNGFYCDESLEPVACGWIPECVNDLTCGCLTGALGSDCSCEERDSGLFVDCG